MFKIAVAPGDGIGKEVIAEGVKVLQAAADVEGVKLQLDHMDLGSDRYLRTGELLTEEDIAFMRQHQAVYFGAIGDPRVAPGVLEKGILIKMRTTFDQYVNMRPSKAWHPYTPLKGEKNFDILFLRENTEDFYMRTMRYPSRSSSAGVPASWEVSTIISCLSESLLATSCRRYSIPPM